MMFRWLALAGVVSLSACAEMPAGPAFAPEGAGVYRLNAAGNFAPVNPPPVYSQPAYQAAPFQMPPGLFQPTYYPMVRHEQPRPVNTTCYTIGESINCRSY